MKPFSPFEHRRDGELGRALREVLQPDDHRAFVARVLARARTQVGGTGSASWWDVLGTWSGPGMAAAIALMAIALAGYLGAGAPPAETAGTLEDALVQSEEERTLLIAPNPPDADVVLAAWRED